MLARILADALSLAGEERLRIFDTDFPDGGLAGYFPASSRIVDFTRTGDRVLVFDTMVDEPDHDYVVDLQANLLKPFFKVYSDIAFDEGAAEAGIAVSVYFMLDRTLTSVNAAAEISRLAGSASFVPVRNEAIGNILAIPEGARRYEAIRKNREIMLPRLSVDALNLIDDPQFSFSGFVARNGEGYPLELKIELFQFLETIYNQRRADEAGGPVTL